MTQHLPKILLLDDDYESMNPFKGFLEALHDYQVELTAAETVLDRLRREKFDLICIDCMIHPKSLDAEQQEVVNIHFDNVNWQRTGLEFLTRLRQGDFSSEDGPGTSPQVPVIMLSAVVDPAYEMANGTTGLRTIYKEKPFDPEELAECIQQML
jgi:CheY-like chemotaxis protein